MTRKKREVKSEDRRLLLPYLHDTRLEIKYYQGGRMGVTLFGCSMFVTYDTACMTLRLRKKTVQIAGRELRCRLYGNRVAEIVGYVENVSFSGVGDD